jgi:hypothetical protein
LLLLPPWWFSRCFLLAGSLPRNLHATVPRKQSHLLLERRLAPASEILLELAVGG